MATVNLRRLTGAGETGTNITAGSTRFSTSDSPTPGSTNQLVKPISGSTYSYWIVQRLYAVTSPTSIINNIKWYMTGVNPLSGVTLEVVTASAYSQATGSIGATGNRLNVTNYPSITGTPAANNAFSYTSGSPLSVTGSIANPTTGYFGNYLVLQLTISSSATSSVLASVTENWQWDEV